MSQNLIPQLEYEFSREALLKEALTHRSAGRRNNERLEFLGDGLLNFVIGEAVYRARPNAEEGDLSRLRASLVRGATLVEIADEIGLGQYLTLGPGELKIGGARSSSILADSVEALLGAIYLDGGFERAREVILSLFQTRLQNLPEPQQLKDSKTRLQEYLQARHCRLPDYEVRDVQGQGHRQTFHVRANIADLALHAEGSGRSRRKAEQQAARGLLEQLGE